MKRCNWCGRFVRRDMPAFTWWRAFSLHVSIWVEPLGWTAPQVLCSRCAESAHDWKEVHHGLFAEVGP